MSRVLSLSSKIPDLAQFTPVRLSGSESINQLYEYTLILKTPDEGNFNASIAANIDLSSWLYQSLTVGIELDGKSVQKDQLNAHNVRDYWHEVVGQGTRHINGLIETAQFLYNQGRSSYYQVSIRPWLQQATLRSDYKIHQNLNALELLRIHLNGYSHPVEYRLSTPEAQYPIRFPKRDYQCQFNESDFTFFARTCSEWGLNWWFEHAENGHKLIIADSQQAHKRNPSEAYHQVYYYPPDYKIAEEYLHELNIRAKTVSGSFALNDYDYTQPNANLLYQKQRSAVYPEAQAKSDANVAKAVHQIYSYTADTVQPKAGPMQESNEVLHENPYRAAWNLERLQQEHFQAEAKGYIRGLTVGHTFALKGHPSKVANINWRINGSELLLVDLAEESQRAANQNNTASSQNTSGSVLEGLGAAMLGGVVAKLSQLGTQLTGSAQQWHIENHLQLVPANVVSRPELIEKPRGALQTAIVVGEAADSIYTDALGRIKVQFHWDRYGVHNPNSSCWVRINQPWAGNQMGATFIPRVGQEVLIDFINADPDLLICIGKVHNQSNLPSWQLTHNQALSGFRSRELGEGQAGNSASGRSNHLVFDDSEEHIQTQLKSDHAHSQLSMGDIARIDGNGGRKEARGQGFELRTDDWGSIRTAKGLYLSTFDRSAATGIVMDAKEPTDLFVRSQEINEALAKVAKKLEAEPVNSGKELKSFAKSLQI